MKMFSLKRNQVIITALVLMICVAGYLNWADSRDSLVAQADDYDRTADGEVAAIIMDGATSQEVGIYNDWWGESAIATGDAQEETTGETDSADSEPGAAVFVSATGDSSFFVLAKLTREQDRSKQKETLTNLMGSNEIDKDTKALCAEAILEISSRMDKESVTESALVAKGFGESYVRIDDSWVEVIINKAVISDQELAQLEDIVTRHTGAAVDQIRLSSAKN